MANPGSVIPRAIKVALVLCLLAILAGPFYTEAGYSQIAHSVSELAAQNTHNAWIMRLGLSALGLAMILGFLSQANRLNLAFLLFGVFILLAALFPHKPFVPDRPSSDSIDLLHSIASSMAGFSAVLGFVMLAVVHGKLPRRLLYAGLAAAYTLLPLGMMLLPQAEGALQRMLFLSFILWALADYPQKMPPGT